MRHPSPSTEKGLPVRGVLGGGRLKFKAEKERFFFFQKPSAPPSPLLPLDLELSQKQS